MAMQGLRSIAITHLHAVKVYDLPLHHADPFDRMIIAQAMVEQMTVLTSDRVFEKYPIEVMVRKVTTNHVETAALGCPGEQGSPN
jgi:PIN domain nuclease of toxin-antitoxin system